MRQRIYHPETDEPFDVPVGRASDLRLNHGWRSTPISHVDVETESDFGRGTGTDRADFEDDLIDGQEPTT